MPVLMWLQRQLRKAQSHVSKTFLRTKGLVNKVEEHHEVRMLCNMISRGWQVKFKEGSEGDKDEMRSVMTRKLVRSMIGNMLRKG